MLMCLGACAPEHSTYSDFRDLPHDGWYASMPLRFCPEITDSTVTTCDVAVAVRHSSSYAYSDLSLVVDMIDSTHHVKRRLVTIPVADKYGNWKGTGFGGLYQLKCDVARNMPLSSILSIVVWQSMKGCEKVECIENVGVIVTPSNK